MTTLPLTRAAVIAAVLTPHWKDNSATGGCCANTTDTWDGTQCVAACDRNKECCDKNKNKITGKPSWCTSGPGSTGNYVTWEGFNTSPPSCKCRVRVYNGCLTQLFNVSTATGNEHRKKVIGKNVSSPDKQGCYSGDKNEYDLKLGSRGCNADSNINNLSAGAGKECSSIIQNIVDDIMNDGKIDITSKGRDDPIECSENLTGSPCYLNYNEP